MERILVHLDEVLAKIPVVSEFMDIFEDLLGLLPNRAVKFSINVLPSASHISRTLYWMGPTELEEVKISCMSQK